jgi:hypothetical protein
MTKRRVELGRRLLFMFLVAAGFGLLARPAAAGTITVAWDLMSDADVTGYRVFVGTSSGVYTQTFDVPASSDFFIFRNAFMGVRYYFAVAAEFNNERIGARSGEVSAVGTRTVGGSLPDGARIPDQAVASECGADCFVVTDVASGLGDVSSIAVANDGTVFAVEDGRRVVVVRGGAAVTAFEAEPGTTLRDIALDPQFGATGRAFLSLVRSRDRMTADLEVLRLRYLAGTLGEPAAIVGGISVPLDAAAPIAVGDDALVYVALPSLIARHPYSASVLAFDQDGRVPDGQRTPWLARGLEQPIDMAWDGQTRAVWLAGRDAAAAGQLLQVSQAAGAVAFPNLTAGEPAASVAVASGVRRLVVAAGVDLIDAAPGGADSLRIALDAYGSPGAVAAWAGARYVVVRAEGASGSRVVKVEDGSLRAAR